MPTTADKPEPSDLESGRPKIIVEDNRVGSEIGVQDGLGAAF